MRPALIPTSVKCARNGIPEGLPRGSAFTVRVATPCAHEKRLAQAPAIRAIARRRESFIAMGWNSTQIEHGSCALRSRGLPQEYRAGAVRPHLLLRSCRAV